MCYCKCPYENYYGERNKPARCPCPQDEEDVAAYEQAREEKAEARREDRRDNAE